MNVFFDVDFTLIAVDGTLRPHVKEVFSKIKEAGHKIYIWSGAGIRWEVVKQHELTDLIETCYLKPLSDYRQKAIEFGVDVVPDYCIDDHSEVVRAFGGFVIGTYYTRDVHDTTWHDALLIMRERLHRAVNVLQDA